MAAHAGRPRVPGPVLSYLESVWPKALEDLREFLRIPSISASSAHAADVGRAARWVADRLARAGVEHVEILPTQLHPVVMGDWLHAPGRPGILVYGHFDTQPVDPEGSWHHPPFEPYVEGDRIYARGATDDKGNMLIPILACEAYLKTTGELPVNVRFLFEGQEEVGSPFLPDFVAEHRERMGASWVVSADGGQFAEDQGALTAGTRGLCAVQIDVSGPSHDLHSGTCGGAVQNPIHALVSILASMRAPDGHVLVEGFYDDVAPLSTEQRRLLARVPFSEGRYAQELGVPELFGEPGYTTLERLGLRPTLEVNGIWGGFAGEGVKTVLPASAHAKVTCRLVPDQDPRVIQERVEAHVKRHAPRGVRVSVRRMPGLARPYAMPLDHPANVAAARVLQEVYGKEPLYLWSGGTVPLYEVFLSQLGIHTVTFAFGLPDERAHAPDEFFRISSMRRGMGAWAHLLASLGPAA